MVGGAPSKVALARQRALAAGLFGSLLTSDLAEQLSTHPVALQVIRRHGMIGLLHAATPAATTALSVSASVAPSSSSPEEKSADYGLLAAVALALRRLCCSIWLEETGLLGEEIGAVLGALVAVTLPPVLAAGRAGSSDSGICRLALEQLWLPLMHEQHNGETNRHVILSLFVRHDLLHGESSRLFGEPSLLVSKRLLGALCALAARGDANEEQEQTLAGITGAGALAFNCLCRLVEEIHSVVLGASVLQSPMHPTWTCNVH
jgi:hypothetical protein